RRLRELIDPYRKDLAQCPLYISLDKDVMAVESAVVNWDSGRLTWPEVKAVLMAFVDAVPAGLIGMDAVGDWSAVEVAGLLRRFLHFTEHPALPHDEEAASNVNERTNLALVGLLLRHAHAVAAAAQARESDSPHRVVLTRPHHGPGRDHHRRIRHHRRRPRSERTGTEVPAPVAHRT